MDAISTLFFAVLAILGSPEGLFSLAWATTLGILVGMLPGLTATLGIALMTTLTFRLPAGDAVLILVCMYTGAIYGGSRSAILLNIPGTPANAATALDGFAMASRGRAGEALAYATASSAIGTIIGVFALALVAPLMAEFALEFGSFEFFWLAVFGVIISGQLTSTDDPIKGWIAGFLGLSIAMIGQEGIHGYQRFTYGWTEISGGISLLPALVGTFGLAELLSVMKSKRPNVLQVKKSVLLPRFSVLWKSKLSIGRSGLLGTLMGLVPGVGEDMGAWTSYAAARASSRKPEEFGKGSVEGLIAAETGNSAAVPGAIIPVLVLAVPGSAPAAVLLAALMIHGVRPGPLIMIENPTFIYEMAAMLFCAALSMFVVGVALSRILLLILWVPRERLMPIIFTLCTIGSFAIASRYFDIWVMLVMGVVGFALREMKYPMAPLVLGIVLGDILDKSLRRGLNLSDGSIEPFFLRPISFVLFLACTLTILFSIGFVRKLVCRGANRVVRRNKG